jgi:hypothetical protein
MQPPAEVTIWNKLQLQVELLVPCGVLLGRERLGETFLFSKAIQLLSEFKYLGLTLNKELTWEKQQVEVTSMVYSYRAFETCRCTSGEAWGLKPKMMYSIYTLILRTVVTCAATVWWPRINFKRITAELSKLRRMASLGIAREMKTAPAAATEILGLLHCTCSWRLRPEQEFNGTTAVINGNPKLMVLDMHTGCCVFRRCTA